MTLVEARVILNPHGMRIMKIEKEYRVSFKVRELERRNLPLDPEPSAYYTNDIMDAVSTGLEMARVGGAKALNTKEKREAYLAREKAARGDVK
jgi:hypothetical protein